MIDHQKLTRDQLVRLCDVYRGSIESFSIATTALFGLPLDTTKMNEACQRIAGEKPGAAELRGFHTHSGWQFLRGDCGSVAVITPDGDEHVVDAGVWCSVVASVSAGGEGDLRWYAAKAFHESRGQQAFVSVPPGYIHVMPDPNITGELAAKEPEPRQLTDLEAIAKWAQAAPRRVAAISSADVQLWDEYGSCCIQGGIPTAAAWVRSQGET